MALKQFALPLDEESIQTGDISVKQLVVNYQTVTFRLTNVTGGTENTLDLITHKNGSAVSHRFEVTVAGGNASVDLTPSQLLDVFNDADGGDWDYIEADWTVGAVDTPNNSQSIQIQSGSPYDTNGFPPKLKP